MYLVKQVGYCGMASVPLKRDTEAEARTVVARLLVRRRREGFPIETLVKGKEWEVRSPTAWCTWSRTSAGS